MKRDWKIIRNILTYIGDERIQHLDAEDQKIYKHCCLLKHAGYIEFKQGFKSGAEEPTYVSGWLTWKGHDLLEYIGNGIAIEDLEEYGHPITDYMLEKYAEFLMGRDLLDEEDSEFVD